MGLKRKYMAVFLFFFIKERSFFFKVKSLGTHRTVTVTMTTRETTTVTLRANTLGHLFLW